MQDGISSTITKADLRRAIVRTAALAHWRHHFSFARLDSSLTRAPMAGVSPNCAPATFFQTFDNCLRQNAEGNGTSPSMVTLEVDGGVIIVDREFSHLLELNPRVNKGTYSRYVAIYPTRKAVRLARLIVDAPAGMVVDHINGNPLDNRLENLRVCTVQQNNWNRKRRRVGNCQFKGVSRAKNQTRWTAAIWPNGRQRYLGAFDTAEEAARAYDAAAREEYGEFACLNFPEAGEQSSQRPNFHAQEVPNL